jgi:pyruvate/2-oxoglutarate dehydrogenase complex dihydrolipoamide acyltransferase (E2) component
MPVTVTMPQMGESVVEGTIEQWLVREGDRVEKDQILCEVSTDKVDAEIPAPESGVVAKILVAEGETIEVGTEIAVLEPVGKGTAAVEETLAETTAAEAPAEVAAAEEAAEGVEPRRYSPLVRRMAEEQGIDLERVPAAREGRVTREDLLAWVEQQKGAARAEPDAGAPGAPHKQKPTAPPPGGLLEFLSSMRVPTYQPREGDRVIPFSAVRRRIAEHMVVSKIVSPHVGTVAELDLQGVVRLRERVKGEFQKAHGFKLTYLPFVVQATVRALRDFPRMNATVVGQTVVERAGIHVGVAVETDRGLGGSWFP